MSPDGGSGALRHDTVTFLSDYGHTDEFVGLVKSVIHQLAPGVDVIDLTHEIPPYDTRRAALTLARSVQYVCPGILLAVVDPGVGTDRRPVAIEVAGGRAVLVGPDNGVLAAAVGMVGGAERAVVLDRPAYHLEAPGPTFDGRDVFAPVTAHLCLGVPLDEVGTPVSPASLVPGMLPLSRFEDDELVGEVLWIDRYGNAQLNVDPAELEGWGTRVGVVVDGRSRTATRVRAFAELEGGALGLLVDSYGLMALVADRAPAAEMLELDDGAEVRLRRLEDDPVEPAAAVTTSVELGARRGTTGGEGR